MEPGPPGDPAFFGSLSRRVYVAFLLAAVLPIAAAGAIGVYLSLQTLRTETLHNLEQEVRGRAQGISRYFEQMTATLLYLAEDREPTERELSALAAAQPHIRRIRLADRESRKALGLQPGQIHVSALHRDGARPVIQMATPQAGAGGLLVMELDADILLGPVQAMADARGGTAYLLDRSGHYLARSPGGGAGNAAMESVERLGGRFPPWVVEAMLRGRESPLQGEGWVVAHAPIDLASGDTLDVSGAGWKIALVFPAGELFRPIRNLYLLYGLLLAAMAATAVGGYALSRRLLKPLEERASLEAVVASTADGILAVDRAGTLHMVNPAGARLLGAEGTQEGTQEGAPVGRPLEAFWPQWPAIAADAAREVLRCDLELPGRVLALTVTPTAAGFIVVARDVSREREILGQRRELDRQMFQMDKMATLGELAMGIAHEIGNPLAGMKAVAQAMQYEEDIPPGLIEALRRLEGEVDRLSGFLRTFHGFAAPQAIRPEACDLEPLLDDVLFWTRRDARARGIGFDLHGVSRLPPLWADPNQLKQVFLNLVMNAVNAMPEGGRIAVAAGVENGRARIEVRDTGTGIAPEVLAHIFEPFYTTRREGTGLGLAIVRKIVEQHGGRIEASSTPGQGSSFSILWPLAGKGHG